MRGHDINSINEQDRARLMHDNPGTTAWFFNKRVDVFMKKFVIPLYKVKDFWYRFEWQHRGCPHVHGLLWLEGAPDRSNIESMSDEQKKISSIISIYLFVRRLTPSMKS